MGTKIAVGFGIVVALMGVMGFSSIRAAQASKAEVDSLYNDSIKGTAAMGSISNFISQYRLQQWRKLAVSDPALRKTTEESIKRVQTSLSEAMTMYEKAISVEEDRKNFDQLRGYVDNYNQLHQQYGELLSSGKEAAATKLMATEMKEAFDDQLQKKAEEMVRDMIAFESAALRTIEDVDLPRLQSFLTRYADALAAQNDRDLKT